MRRAFVRHFGIGLLLLSPFIVSVLVNNKRFTNKKREAHPGKTNATNARLKLVYIEEQCNELPNILDNDFLYLLPHETHGIDCAAII